MEVLAPRDDCPSLERSRPSTLRKIPMLGDLDTIGEELIHHATMAAASTGRSRSRQRHARCKWRVWFAGPRMVRGIARLRGMGSAGSRHARTIMWHGTASVKESRDLCHALSSRRFQCLRQ